LLFKISLLSYEPDLWLAADGAIERSVSLRPEIVFSPRNDVHLATEVTTHISARARYSFPVGLAQHEDVNVARAVLGAERERSEDERDTHVADAPKRRRESSGQSNGALRQLLQWPEHWILLIQRPEPDVADPPATEDALLRELLEGDVNGTRRATGTTNDLARV
jgi:hypothetical protein